MAREPGKDAKLKLGEILVEYGIITSNMLENALRRQSQVGGQIGSVLIEMGYISPDTLLEFMSKKVGTPSANLFNIDIPREVLETIPFEKMKAYKILPLEIDNQFMIAMVNPNDYVALRDIEFIVGRRVTPVIVPAAQMDAAMKLLQSPGIRGLKGSAIQEACMGVYEEVAGEAGDIRMLLTRLAEAKATDLQLTAGVPPSLKMSTELQRLNLPPLTPEQTIQYSNALMSEERREKFSTANDIDFAFTDPDLGRFRVNIYKQRNSVSITLRRIPERIPDLKELGLPDDLEEMALKSQGLILITGPAGHGKSTTLAALVDIINTRRKCNIITLEDPIEYLYKHKNSNVNQREIGLDTASFHEGLRHIFRQDPDVIVIGEMRDPESFEIALQAAETGHLVLSTLHSRNATSTIERVIDIFPPHQQPQIRTQLAESLIAVISQRLVLRKDKTGSVLAYERLLNNLKIKNFIREGKTHQIRSQMLVPGEEYSSIDVSLARLCLEGKITAEEGSKHADNVAFYQDSLRGKGIR